MRLSDRESDAFSGEGASGYEIERLRSRIGELEREIDTLRLRAEQGLGCVEEELFRSLTGFHDVEEARREFEAAGGDRVFAFLNRHGSSVAQDDLKWAKDKVVSQFPKHREVANVAFSRLQERFAPKKARKDRRGSSVVVDQFHLFLLPFVYVYGGILEEHVPALPGYGVSASQISRLLNVSVPVVATVWASKYYSKRGIEWLRENAAPGDGGGEEYRNADIVLFIDGGTVSCEKSGGSREQKELFDAGKDEDHVVRVMVVCSQTGFIIEVSSSVGGRTTEVKATKNMLIPERLNEEATNILGQQIEKVKLHFVVDRGFYDYRNWLREQQYDGIDVTVEIPFHLNTPGKRGKKSAAQKEIDAQNPKRKQHAAEEVSHNRGVAAHRYVNEWAVGELKHARLFHRMFDLSTAHNIDNFFAISAGISNFRSNKRAE